MKTKFKKKSKPKFSIRNYRFYLYLREINNFFYILRTIKRERLTNQWAALNLRADWVGRIYTVINLRNEDVGENDTIKRARVYEQMLPINNYIKTLDLHEIVFPAIEQQSERSYLVVYSPLFKSITFFRTLKYLFIVGIFSYVLINLPTIISFIKKMFIWI